MGTQKQKRTKAARNQRRSHHALDQIGSTKCAKCGKEIKPHHACSNCGFYKGREVIDVLKKLSPKERKKAVKAKDKEEGKKNKEAKEIEKK